MPWLPARFLRRKLTEYGLFPSTVLGQLTLYMWVLVLGLTVVRQIAILRSSTPGAGAGLKSWIVALGFIACALFLLAFLRWVRQVLMWRLRNRLLITYLFIGLVPMALLAILAGITSYMFAGQFATYLAHNKIRGELRSLEATNQTIAAQVASKLQQGGNPAEQMRSLLPGQESVASQFPKRSVIVFHRGIPVLSQTPINEKLNEVITAHPPAWLKADFSGLMTPNGRDLYLAVASLPVKENDGLTVVSLVPLDHDEAGRLAEGIGEITIFRATVAAPGSKPERASHPIIYDAKDDDLITTDAEETSAPQIVGGGSVPPQVGRFDQPVRFGTFSRVRDWGTGKERGTFLTVITRPSTLYAQLFSSSTDFAELIYGVLIGTTIFFALILLTAVVIGLGLARRITDSVARLYRATQHVNRGDLRHRINVKNADQLAALERSFNSMMESLDRLILEQKEKERLESEIAIAQQVQAQLFPREDPQISTLEIFGLCKPAQTVSGDYYDFLPMGEDRLGIAVGDISGKGISAALLMATVHSAVRVFEYGGTAMQRPLAVASAAGVQHERRSGSGSVPPSQVLSLLNRHLYHSTPPEKYATLFLSLYDGPTRTLTYSNGGHLPPLLVSRRGIRKLEDGGTVVGLLDGMTYTESSVVLQPGELFLAYSDGITEPENEFGEFGDQRLLELVQKNFDLPLERLSDLIFTAVGDWLGSAGQPDDMTLVLARAR